MVHTPFQIPSIIRMRVMDSKVKNLIKNKINQILKIFGYHIVKADISEGDYRPHLIKFIESFNSKIKGDLLDVGAGSWTWVKDTYKNKVKITSFDNIKTADIDIVGDIHELSKYLTGKKFDIVFCLETMEHVKNPFIAMDEIKSVLKPGGLLIASTPFRHKLHGEEYGDYWRITRQGWKELLSGFKDIQIIPVGEELNPHHYMISAVRI